MLDKDQMKKMQMEKRERLTVIKEIVQKQDIKTQAELMGALEDRHIFTNQPTLSRDIKTLGLEKDADGHYKISKALRRQEEKKRIKKLMHDGDVKLNVEPFKVVMLRTSSLYGSIIADTLERYFEEEGYPLGTLVGPSGTVLLIVNEDNMSKLLDKIKHLLSEHEVDEEESFIPEGE